MRVPQAFIAKIKKGNIDDPLLKKVLPIIDEALIFDHSFTDLPQEHENILLGLLHKYSRRVLLIIKSGCAINYRYCFRRHFPYQANNLTKRRLNHVVDYLNDPREVNEIILSEGHPLMSQDDFLQYIISTLETLPQLKRLRIHTKLSL